MSCFIYRRTINYYETDAMGVVHHTNYSRIFEEARVAFLKDRGLMHLHAPQGELTFAVLNMSNRFYKPAYFDDELEVWTQSRIEGVRIYFQYALYSPRMKQFLADGTTELIPLTAQFRPTKIPRELSIAYRQEPWSEVWPPPLL